MPASATRCPLILDTERRGARPAAMARPRPAPSPPLVRRADRRL